MSNNGAPVLSRAAGYQLRLSLNQLPRVCKTRRVNPCERIKMMLISADGDIEQALRVEERRIAYGMHQEGQK